MRTRDAPVAIVHTIFAENVFVLIARIGDAGHRIAFLQLIRTGIPLHGWSLQEN